jgi:hypothetical protein
MDAREEIKRWLALLIQMADEVESKTIKQDADMLLAVASELTGKLAARNAALAKKIRPRSAKPPKASPQRGPQQQDGGESSTDTPKTQTGAEGRSQEQSRIGQGIQQVLNRPSPTPSPQAQQQQLWRQIYGAQNKDVAFRKAAAVVAR